MEFTDRLGAEAKREKCKIRRSNAFLGLTDTFPTPHNEMTLAITLELDKERRWARLIHHILDEGRGAHASLGSLIVRLGFTKTACGRLSCATHKPHYTKLYSVRYRP